MRIIFGVARDLVSLNGLFFCLNARNAVNSPIQSEFKKGALLALARDPLGRSYDYGLYPKQERIERLRDRGHIPYKRLIYFPYKRFEPYGRQFI